MESNLNHALREGIPAEVDDRCKLGVWKIKVRQYFGYFGKTSPSGKEVLEVLLSDNELDSPDIVRVFSPARPDLLHHIVVQGPHCRSHRLKCCPGQVTAICISYQYNFILDPRSYFGEITTIPMSTI